MEKEELVVAGFSFQTLEDAELAREEEKKIEYIESRMNYSKPDGILPIYNKMLENAMFQTPVGYLYMRKLRDFLVQNLPEETIAEISVKRLADRVIPEALSDKKISKLKEDRIFLKQRLKISIIVNIIFLLAIIAMFVITLNGSTPNALNYERVLQDRYATWEEELKEREAIIREKEHKLQE